MRDKKTEAMVSVALELTRDPGNVVGEAVTDEELAAYLEGGLDAVRRAQVDSYIANDSEVYARWMRFVENMEAYDLDSASEAELQTSQEKPGILASIIEGLRRLTSHGAFMPGSAFSLFAIGFLAFTLFQKTNTLDTLYSDFGVITEGNTLILPTRSFNPLEIPREISSEDYLLKQGVSQGLDAMGLDELNDAVIPSADISISNSDQKTYINLGRWAVLSHYQCSIKSQQFLTKALPVYEVLEKDLTGIQSDYALQLSQTIQRIKNSAANVATDKAGSQYLCTIADYLVQQSNFKKQ
jgi:hypothetical protein